MTVTFKETIVISIRGSEGVIERILNITLSEYMNRYVLRHTNSGSVVWIVRRLKPEDTHQYWKLTINCLGFPYCLHCRKNCVTYRCLPAQNMVMSSRKMWKNAAFMDGNLHIRRFIGKMECRGLRINIECMDTNMY